ncbi:MAG: hypothetical protein M1834_001638 [Cirrosporium novae-zelandiae]|nr:MAG: hypothetical protein M1834_004155 [Cirrosporium novae-zelandiae]KAI9735622.1 MAG: hypothetical protein M1834_001638 [Cirrosporium novae-zelandiae]
MNSPKLNLATIPSDVRLNIFEFLLTTKNGISICHDNSCNGLNYKYSWQPEDEEAMHLHFFFLHSYPRAVATDANYIFFTKNMFLMHITWLEHEEESEILEERMMKEWIRRVSISAKRETALPALNIAITKLFRFTHIRELEIDIGIVMRKDLHGNKLGGVGRIIQKVEKNIPHVTVTGLVGNVVRIIHRPSRDPSRDDDLGVATEKRDLAKLCNDLARNKGELEEIDDSIYQIRCKEGCAKCASASRDGYPDLTNDSLLCNWLRLPKNHIAYRVYLAVSQRAN